MCTEINVAYNYSISTKKTKKTDTNLRKHRCHVVLNDYIPVSMISFLDWV